MNTFVSTAFMHLVAGGAPSIQADEAAITNLVKRPLALFFRRGRDFHAANGNDQVGVFGKAQVLLRFQDAVLEDDSDISVDRHGTRTVAGQDIKSKDK